MSLIRSGGSGIRTDSQVDVIPLSGQSRGLSVLDYECAPTEVCNYVIYQVGALETFCKMAGVRLGHVKFHGAPARMSAGDEELAEMLAESISRYDKSLVLVAFAGSAFRSQNKKPGACLNCSLSSRQMKKQNRFTGLRQ